MNSNKYRILIVEDDSNICSFVKTVLVKDMSRVGRNYVETGFYTEVYFSRMGVRFIAINNKDYVLI